MNDDFCARKTNRFIDNFKGSAKCFLYFQYGIAILAIHLIFAVISWFFTNITLPYHACGC